MSRTITLTDYDTEDQADLYVDGQLVLPALTAEERSDLFYRLAQLDGAAAFPYDVRELLGLQAFGLPPAFAIVHNASVGHLAVWHDGEPAAIAEQHLDRRKGEEYVRAQAEALATEVGRRVREGEL